MLLEVICKFNLAISSHSMQIAFDFAFKFLLVHCIRILFVRILLNEVNALLAAFVLLDFFEVMHHCVLS